jgi:hypothetical protein
MFTDSSTVVDYVSSADDQFVVKAGNGAIFSADVHVKGELFVQGMSQIGASNYSSVSPFKEVVWDPVAFDVSYRTRHFAEYGIGAGGTVFAALETIVPLDTLRPGALSAVSGFLTPPSSGNNYVFTVLKGGFYMINVRVSVQMIMPAVPLTTGGVSFWVGSPSGLATTPFSNSSGYILTGTGGVMGGKYPTGTGALQVLLPLNAGDQFRVAVSEYVVIGGSQYQMVIDGCGLTIMAL